MQACSLIVDILIAYLNNGLEDLQRASSGVKRRRRWPNWLLPDNAASEWLGALEVCGSTIERSLSAIDKRKSADL